MFEYVKNNKLGTLALIMACAFVLAGWPAQVWKIWATKNVEGISPLFVSSFLVQAIVWLLYGIQKRNLPILVPNFFAVIFSAIALFEWFLFK